MFQGFTQQTLGFLKGIGIYNEKSWFEEHKQQYRQHLLMPMRQLAAETYDAFQNLYPQFDLEPKVCRIYRDIRRCHGKGPYKDRLWFTFSQRMEEDMSAKLTFWFELAAESWSYGLGYYQAKPALMAKHRARIDRQPQRLAKLARRLQKQKEFVLEGPAYVRPKGDPGPLLRDWYNKKSFALSHEEAVGPDIFSPALIDRLLEGYSFLAPFYEYFSDLAQDAD
ncbi:MAG: DUF2461 domain-containing protein [Firmicutes bacterium]|nr:DUF2461 domain-containing protein [Bacillota bacterium]